ncbi:hypothetical protein TSAR_012718 [Trichomalopsis sarcophagae]|uniref:Peptidase aspartic putative domain-containing protein n=1 Tax=Trichomalopsis sarcophagae TaxID=543379 RepID=A0A232FHW1_9HYME|nr:hypothetical protein TSAR_012718 [Trichomalopsis sarcophagae]
MPRRLLVKSVLIAKATTLSGTVKRVEHAVAARLCLNCLSHDTASCTSKNRCFVCNERHHKKLHQEAKIFVHIFSLVLKRPAAVLPRKEVPMKEWPHLKGLQLADPNFGIPGRIDCILNAEIHAVVIASGVAQNSVLGWLLTGGTGTDPGKSREEARMHHIGVDQALSKALTRFWEEEEVATTV